MNPATGQTNYSYFDIPRALYHSHVSLMASASYRTENKQVSYFVQRLGTIVIAAHVIHIFQLLRASTN